MTPTYTDATRDIKEQHSTLESYRADNNTTLSIGDENIDDINIDGSCDDNDVDGGDARR